MRSQNARFKAEFPTDTEFEHPPGAWPLRRLSADIAGAGWETSEFDNWRDSGWSIRCSRDNATLEVVIAPWGEKEWLLQVAPADRPGYLRRMFGARASATPPDLLLLAKAIHSILSNYLRVKHLMWRVDGPPDEDHSTSEP
jgi:hypothetical protein